MKNLSGFNVNMCDQQALMELCTICYRTAGCSLVRFDDFWGQWVFCHKIMTVRL